MPHARTTKAVLGTVPLSGSRNVYLHTYYAFTSLLVVILVISLIWYPFVQLMTEVNTLITRLVIYFNVEVLGFTNSTFCSALESVFLSKQTLAVTTGLCISCALYLASGDLLHFAAAYIANLPTNQTFYNVKQCALEVIEGLLSLTGNIHSQKVKSK